ncbi:MAG: AgmX/PglI C-terminal domain-containing protein [Deltaproteobacteria bacterium]|nr:AgmX/PglI C-terminal domain-containing protein [Deltaproteobacteria bacterium]
MVVTRRMMQSRLCLEVSIAWGDTLLRVVHLAPPRDFSVGVDPGCDVAIPAEILGAPRSRIVEVTRTGDLWLVVPDCAKGWVQNLSDARIEHVGPREQSGSRRKLALRYGAVGWIEMGAIKVRISVEQPVRRPSRWTRSGAGWALGSMLLSLVAHAAGLMSGWLYAPPLGISESEDALRDQMTLMQQYLSATAQTERDWPVEAVVSELPIPEGGTGVRSKGEEGGMGTISARGPIRRFGIKGPADNADAHIASLDARSEAAEFGLIGLLNAGAGGDPYAPVAAWGRESSLGTDALSASGAMWGEAPGEAFGVGGLGLSGIGEGGGGRGEGLGLGRINTVGHGAGTGTSQGFGKDGEGRGMSACGCGDASGHYYSDGFNAGSAGRMRAGRKQGALLAAAAAEQDPEGGRLPPETIQRIVRGSYGRYRACYQSALKYNPSLAGRVSVRFIIARDGSVAIASDAGSDLADRGAVQCVLASFRQLSFPSPVGGIVSVLYPLVFSPA